MKIKILCILIIIFTFWLGGCDEAMYVEAEHKCQTVTVDDCEYIVYSYVGWNTYSGITHKGNCKNH